MNIFKNLYFALIFALVIIDSIQTAKNKRHRSSDLIKISRKRNIFGGKIINKPVYEAKYIAAIVHVGPCCNYQQFPESNIKIYCTGIIINQNYVLTSADCILKNHIDIEQFIVIFNIDPVVKWTMYVKDNNSPIHYSSIRSYKLHEKYKTSSPSEYNLAMLHLNNPIDFEKSKTKQAPLPYISHFRPYCQEFNEVDLSDVYLDRCTFYGYGLNKDESETDKSGKLKNFVLSLSEADICRHYDSNFNAQLCVCAVHNNSFSKDEKYRGFIEGDYGGPLICTVDDVQKGIDNFKALVIGIASVSVMLPRAEDDKFRLVYYFSSTRYFGDWIDYNSELIE
ncbi:ovochymase-2-like [Dermatophagoides pteronyssinus]|uniref:ovochymase-2-like n=1 Tax=Dermatophagoides pteronyssinus TaxID=6956 RepID=UPI003F66E00B